ncbi:MAG: hypothetical protein IJX71_01080, partial [Oscillospiraceae bacterium]|nr:hypothetical protein [Oscillospiraceae bacterium]
LTRAKEKLHLTCASHRMIFGHTTSNRPSRFTGEIPDKYLEKSGRTPYSKEEREYGGRWTDSGEKQPSQRERLRSSVLDEGERIIGYQSRSTGASTPAKTASAGSKTGSAYGQRRRYQPTPKAGPLGGGSSITRTTATGKINAAAAVQSANLLAQYKKGEMVEHTAFGKGMITAVSPMGGDALIEIAFDNVGTKKMMLKAASQHMKKG